MKKIIRGNVVYYQFEIFENVPGMVKHCFSTRKGGTSTGCYSSMNLAFRDDKRENVINNFMTICNSIDVDYKNIVFSSQIHKANIYNVTEKDVGKGLLRESDIKDTDGLITDRRNIVLTTFYADCVPLFFLDPVKRVIALSHSGWRGCVGKIGPKTVERMAGDYGTNPGDVLAGIGPSIGRCCFQVDLQVVLEFKNNIPFSGKYIYNDESETGKYRIDMQEINKQMLINASVREENIETAGICTKCNSDLFFSHRAMGNERGSMAALMELC